MINDICDLAAIKARNQVKKTESLLMYHCLRNLVKTLENFRQNSEYKKI